MTNEEILQGTLNATLDRVGRQSRSYEAEIANLNAQIIVLSNQVQELTNNQIEVKPEKDDN
jgi:hypothetical protein